MDECIFCKIVRKEIPAVIFHETDEFVAFVDTQPNNFGHSLVVPKKHYDTIYSIDGITSEKLGEELRIVSRAVQKAVAAQGINVYMNNGSAAGQVIFHAHIHIIPRFEDDGFLPWPIKQYASPEQVQEIGEKIKNSIK